ncbi:MAG: segregation and condensation protein [Clostridia bacterium]|nr:segregation and condensation protein [Clostridia bacterium]
MAYYLSLEAYQGPLDMLLLLLKKREMDVFSIPVGTVLNQYLEYLHSLDEFDLELAEELLLLGAELIVFKARLLLSRPGQEEGEPPDAEEVRRRLQEQLSRYRLFLKAAKNLHEILSSRAPSYGRSRDAEAVRRALERVNPLEGITLNDLAAAYRAACRRLRPPEPPALTIARPSVTLAGQARRVLRALACRPGGLPFSSFFKNGYSRLEVVTTLAAVLELACRGRVTLRQNEPFGEIFIYRRKR